MQSMTPQLPMADDQRSGESKRAGAAGIVIDPTARRKGFGAEAFKMVIDYGLNLLEITEARLHRTISLCAGWWR